MINKLDEINLDYVKKTGAILVLRNPEKLKLKDLKKFKDRCTQRKINLYIANSVKILFLLNTNKFYISSYNKKQFWHLKHINRKIDIIGSAHSPSEINEKIVGSSCDPLLTPYRAKILLLYMTLYLPLKLCSGKLPGVAGYFASI